MVDEEGIRLVWHASTHHDDAAKPFGLQDVWLSLRGVHLTLPRTKRSISLRCAPVQCVDQTQMWLCSFLRLYIYIYIIYLDCCPNYVDPNSNMRPFWRTGAAFFQICFYTWEVMKYLGTVGTTAKIWHGWFFGNDGGFAGGLSKILLIVQSWGRRHETRLLKSWIILCYHVGLELPLCKVFYLWTAK